MKKEYVSPLVDVVEVKNRILSGSDPASVSGVGLNDVSAWEDEDDLPDSF